MPFMKTITATQARQSFSAVITSIKTEPTTILKKNKDVAVIISPERYKELKKLEDFLYWKAAILAIDEGFANQKEADDLLDSL